MESIIKEINSDITSIIEGITSLKNWKSINEYNKSIFKLEDLETNLKDYTKYNK